MRTEWEKSIREWNEKNDPKVAPKFVGLKDESLKLDLLECKRADALQPMGRRPFGSGLQNR